MSTLDLNSTGFMGTDNPRYLRIIDALLKGSLRREAVDTAGGVSNGPQAISKIRALFFDGCGKQHLYCTLLDCIDRDGNPCRPGLYSLSDRGRQLILEWLARCNRSRFIHA